MTHSSYQDGIEAVQAGDFQAAIQAFRQVLASDPTHTEARYNLAWVLGMSGYLDPALAELEAVLAADPNHPEAHYNRGALLLQKAQLEAGMDGQMDIPTLQQAEAAFQAVMRLDPSDQRAYAFLNLVKRAIRNYQKDSAAASNPSNRSVP
ncbi:tetratricopeptide repeat protein [Synechococcus sp. Nb3U1]|uniref:tetratricopeptide repeat protein n=1 Tax=Synechococcus sp. Nb3U1 TaxID=1914529 RepID=UPI001F162D23|nr:tetratricopeptide repeat protein [Synechococcus sp. Nb3U1]MCF2972572.1 tetratricopeptide repeat protein [Synechococcus sp. Nb3U1]